MSAVAATLAISAAACPALAGCGGGSGSGTVSLPTPGIANAKVNAINSGDVAIFAAGNATTNIIRHPKAVSRGRQLLKPLVVAETLNVNSSNRVAGGLVEGLTSQLDAAVPGLTKQTSKGEVLDGPVVHRFLVHGHRDPAKVFEPDAAGGVGKLERALRGVRAKTEVSAINPPQTADQLVASDAKLASAYWPGLTKRLKALEASLR